MVSLHLTGDALWERMDRAVENVRKRLEKAAGTLENAGVPYAVLGGNAVRVWVAQVDEAAVRTTRDVDILLRREDLPAATTALQAVGFVHRRNAGIDMFLDGPDAKARDAVHVVFARERVRDADLLPTPDVDESTVAEGFRVVTLDALVLMKLTSFRDKDRTHLRDMLELDLINAAWYDRLPQDLAERLRELVDNPDG